MKTNIHPFELTTATGIAIALFGMVSCLHGDELTAAYNFKDVHGFKGKPSEPSGLIVAAIDFVFPYYPVSYLYIQNRTDDEEVIAAYFEGLPNEVIGAGLDTGPLPFHDWSLWLDAPEFPLSKALDFNPSLAWAGDAFGKYAIRLWIFQELWPSNQYIQAGTLRIGILTRDSKGHINAYVNEISPMDIPVTPR